ncbi:MAG: LysM peptidoglycan-binding domain-containing protein [Desulfitobacteriaceae bacterium]|nr:LysM peptidoglycan-binding domain-containing protein [Desulfitobacteriaceae bacterium]
MSVNEPQVSCPEGRLYTIRAGDTLYAISQRFGVPVQRIIAANPGIDPDNLRVAQIICIPISAVGCPGFVYRIQEGDSLYVLAQRYRTLVDVILQFNPGLDPQNLQIGQAICIPVPGVCPAGRFPYTVRAGDTYFGLAERYGTTVDAIRRANPGVDPNNLQIGQRLCIPYVAG